jgi:hypothetical protein
MKAKFAVLFLLLSAGEVHAATPSAAEVDAAAVKAFESANHVRGMVVAHLDLTADLKTRTQWAFVAVQGPDVKDVYGETAPGRIDMCLVHGLTVDCKGPAFPRMSGLDAVPAWRTDGPDDFGLRAPHEVQARVVSLKGLPRLVVTSSTLHSGDGGHGLSTFILGYDLQLDRLTGLFAGEVGSNNNQRIDVVETGPLAGSVVADIPTSNAPFGYFVTLYQPQATGDYAVRLHYRSRTRYNDGNPLSVIDSEMPEILRRVNLWKAGDPLPQPVRMPAGCKTLELRRGIEWCR